MNIDVLIKKYGIDITDIKGAIDIVDNRQYSLITDSGEVWEELEFIRVCLYKIYIDNYIKKRVGKENENN